MHNTRAILALSLAACIAPANAFAPTWVPAQQPRLRGCSPATEMMARRPNLLSAAMQMEPEPLAAAQKSPAPQLAASAALAIAMVPTVASAAAPEWLEPVRSSLDIGLAVFSLFFFLRIPLTWYPNMDLNKAPQSIVAWSNPPDVLVMSCPWFPAPGCAAVSRLKYVTRRSAGAPSEREVPCGRPTEPFCKLVRGFTPPLFGVDISPVVMYAVLSFIREIFLGQQGVLTMMAMK
jgi:YggT family protein